MYDESGDSTEEADLVKDGDAVRTLDVDAGAVLQQERGEVGLAEVERAVERRLAAEGARVQLAAAVDEAAEDRVELVDVVVDAHGHVQRPHRVARVADVRLTTCGRIHRNCPKIYPKTCFKIILRQKLKCLKTTLNIILSRFTKVLLGRLNFFAGCDLLPWYNYDSISVVNCNFCTRC